MHSFLVLKLQSYAFYLDYWIILHTNHFLHLLFLYISTKMTNFENYTTSLGRKQTLNSNLSLLSG